MSEISDAKRWVEQKTHLSCSGYSILSWIIQITIRARTLMSHIKLLFDVLDWIHPFIGPSLTPDQVPWLLLGNRLSRISRTECGEWNDLWLKPAKPSLKGTLTASFLPAACLLCTKQVRMIHPWWTGWCPEVWHSLLVQHFLRSFSDFPTLLNAMTTDLSRNSCVVHLWLRVAWPSYQPLSCGLRWNGFLMTGHLLVRKQRSKPSAPLPWRSAHHNT